jgi:aminobenzoyl-glutamate transport protein
MPATPSLGQRVFYQLLDLVERIGNKLPHPTLLFGMFAVGVVLLSGVVAWLEVATAHPVTGEPIVAISLLTGDGLRRIVTEMVRNFTGFAPLGTVLVTLLGIGVAEGAGLIGAALRLLVLSAPPRLLTGVIVFAGILSNAASEIGYVLLVPLSAIIFLSAGRHPLAGLAAAFAGVSGGYSANLLIGTIDPLLAGLSQEAAQIIDPEYTVHAAANYYFMVVSTFALTLAGTFVAERIVEPRLGTYEGAEQGMSLERLSPAEKRGLRAALVAGLIVLGLLLWAVVPAEGVLRNPETGDLLDSPFLGGIVAIIFLASTIVGAAYGFAAGTFHTGADLIKSMDKAMTTMGAYIVLVFFASQFVAYFGWTNIGLIIAVEGADLLRSIGFEGVPLVLSFVLLAAGLNMFMGSASAKWALFAPVFVPMFMLLGYAPELTQAAYRIGDSTTNIISPMMSYFPLIVIFVQKYSRESGVGTVIATMLPFTLAFLVVWAVLLAVWILLGIPVGPGGPLHYVR